MDQCTCMLKGIIASGVASEGGGQGGARAPGADFRGGAKKNFGPSKHFLGAPISLLAPGAKNPSYALIGSK